MAFDALKRATQEAALRQLASAALADDQPSLIAKLVFFGVLPAGQTSLVTNIVTETQA